MNIFLLMYISRCNNCHTTCAHVFLNSVILEFSSCCRINAFSSSSRVDIYCASLLAISCSLFSRSLPRLFAFAFAFFLGGICFALCDPYKAQDDAKQAHRYKKRQMEYGIIQIDWGNCDAQRVRRVHITHLIRNCNAQLMLHSHKANATLADDN